MPLLRRWILRPLLLAGVCAAVSTAKPVAPAAQSRQISISASTIAERVVFPEVRLRKLHLVRPDLIPYPIYYQIYC